MIDNRALKVREALTWSCSPYGDAVPFADVTHLTGVPGGGQNVGQQDVLIIRSVLGQLQQVDVSCGQDEWECLPGK
jgi:hypothetical protein